MVITNDVHSETGYNEGDGADTFLRYIEGFVISGLHRISNYGNIHCYIKKSLLRHIIQVCSIFTNSNSPSVANCFAFRFTIWYVSVMLSRTAFQPKDPSPLNIRIFTLTTTFDLPANDVSSTLSHCSFFANISLTVDSPQWKSLARSLLVREGLSSLFWHGHFFALQSMLL